MGDADNWATELGEFRVHSRTHTAAGDDATKITFTGVLTDEVTDTLEAFHIGSAGSVTRVFYVEDRPVTAHLPRQVPKSQHHHVVGFDDEGVLEIVSQQAEHVQTDVPDGNGNLEAGDTDVQAAIDRFDAYEPRFWPGFVLGNDYALREIVHYQNVFYRAKQAITNAQTIPPADADNWEEVTTHGIESYGTYSDYEATLELAALTMPGFSTGIDFVRGATIASQVGLQAVGVVATIVYCGVVSFILLKVLDAVIGLRVNAEEEEEGLDLVLHDEQGYNLS